MIRRSWLITGGVVSIVLIVVGAVGISSRTIRPPSTLSGSAMEGIAGINYSDDRILVGYSHNVFVGRVKNQTGVERPAWATSPCTLFSVDIIENVKGSLSTAITICQFADDYHPLLEPGRSYIFAARYYQEQNWFLIAPKEDYTLLSDNESLTSDQLRMLAGQSQRIKDLKEAYKNEIVLPSDLKDNKAYNSYQSLQSGHLFTPPPFAEANPSAPPVVNEPGASEVTEPTPTGTPELTASPSATPEESVSPTAAPEVSAAPSETSAPTPEPSSSEFASP